MTGTRSHSSILWVFEPVGTLLPSRIKGGCGAECECNKAGFKCTNYTGRSLNGVVLRK